MTIERTDWGRPIPSGFLGLSFEYWAVPSYIGTDPSAINPVLVQLIRNLLPGQQPVLRIGGDTTDWTWSPVPGMRQPAGIRYSLSPGWFASVRALAQATNARFILGVNLEARSNRIAVAEAHALLAGLGRKRIAALEIGNEPELYPQRAWYHKPSGGAVRGRPRRYDFKAFTAEFSRLRRLLPGVPLAGPGTGNFSWLQDLPQFLAAEHTLAQVTFHRYGLNECVTKPASPRYPTVPNLLGAFASRELMNGVGTYVQLAHARGVPFRIDEMNSVTCGGKLGVSTTFGSALWAIDALFEMAGAGVDGVNIHIPRGYNEPFELHDLNGHWQGTVRPEYYGLLMFAQAAPPGSRLLRIRPGDSATIRSWATLAPDGRTRLVLINHSLTQAGSVLVRTPAPAGAATLELLEARSAYATDGVTLAGQTFGSETATGAINGPLRTIALTPVADEYTVKVPAATAAMITFNGNGHPQSERVMLSRPRSS